MAVDSRRSFVCNVALMIGVVFMFTVEETVAQVVIKERVEITSEAAASEKSAEAQVETYLIAPFDGVLKVEYTSADRLLAPMPLSAVLEAQINGISSAVDTVVSRLSFVDSTTIYCDETFPNGYPAPAFYTRFDYTALPDPPPGKRSAAQSAASTWSVTSVAEGDSVVLTYQSPNPGDFATGLTQIDDSTWSLEGGALACYTQPIFHWSDRIEALVTVVRDTLNIIFDPPGTDTLDLPVPGMEITAKAVVHGANGQGAVTFEIQNHAYPHLSQTQVDRIQTNEILFADSTLTHAPVSLSGDTASINLLSTQYWGAVDVTATYVNGADTLTKTKRWPEDEDGDGLLDAWEVAMGGKNMGSCPDPDPDYFEDECADADTSAGNTNDGDGISKLQEYRGVMIGTDHNRLDPRRKDVFFDIDSSAAGQFVIDEVRDQLKLVVHQVSGLKTAPSKFGISGTNELEYLGTAGSDSQTRNYLRIVDRGVANKGAVPGLLADSVLNHRNGIVVAQGTYSRNGVSVGCQNAPNCQPLGAKSDVIYGRTTDQLSTQTGFDHQVVEVYDQTIRNIWDASVNSIPETAFENFRHVVAADPILVPGFQIWQATYAGNNVGTFPGTGEFVNPFDIMGLSGNNVPPDTVVATMTQSDYHARVTLHEVGHALGIRNTCAHPHRDLACHPLQDTTVMRSGFGPAKIKSFLLTEIQEMRLQ